MRHRRRHIEVPAFNTLMSDDDEASGWANVIAIDPGGTTGWSLLMCHPDALVQTDLAVLDNIEHWSHGQFTGDEDKQVRQVMELVEAWPDAAIVLEGFTLRVKRMDDDLLAPVRINAKIEFGLQFWPGLGGQRNNTPVFIQSPSLAMTTATDERLKQWGYYEREGGEQHARDADRHALTFLRRCKEGKRYKEYGGRCLREVAWPFLFLDQPEEGDG